LIALTVLTRRSTALAVGLALLAVGMLVASLGRASLTHGPVADLAHRGGAAHVELAVSSDPQVLPRKPHLPPEVALPARLRVLETTKGRWRSDLPVVVIAPAGSWRSLLPSTRVGAEADFRPVSGSDVAALLVVHGTPVVIRGPSALQRWAGGIRAGLRRAAARLPPSERGLLPGLVVGDTSAMPEAETANFRKAGLTHLNYCQAHGKSGDLRPHLIRCCW
jgi:competence protein ComEC